MMQTNVTTSMFLSHFKTKLASILLKPPPLCPRLFLYQLLRKFSIVFRSSSLFVNILGTFKVQKWSTSVKYAVHKLQGLQHCNRSSAVRVTLVLSGCKFLRNIRASAAFQFIRNVCMRSCPCLCRHSAVCNSKKCHLLWDHATVGTFQSCLKVLNFLALKLMWVCSVLT